MPSPQVLTGLRNPANVRHADFLEGKTAAAPRHPEAPASHDAETVYVSPTRGYRVQITAPQTFIGPDGRKQTGGKMIVAQFVEGVFRNNHKDPAVRKMVDEGMQSNPYFGRFGDGRVHYWLASEQREVTEKARLASALDTLKALPPEQVKLFAAQLTQGKVDDHVVAPIKTATAE